MVTWLCGGGVYDVASGAWPEGDPHAIGDVRCEMRGGVVASNDF